MTWLLTRLASSSSNRRARAAKSWDLYIDAVTARLRKKKGVSAKDRRSLKAKLARLHATELGRIEEAITEYRALVEDDPADEDAVSALDKLLRSENRRDDLRWLFELRATEGPEDQRAGILTEWASLEQDAFGEAPRAADLYRRVLAVDPQSEIARARCRSCSLPRANPPRRPRSSKPTANRLTGEARASRELDLGDIYLDHLGRPEQALSCAARALSTVPHSARSIQMLDRLMAMPQTRAAAAALLESEYEGVNDARQARASARRAPRDDHRARTTPRALPHPRRNRGAPALFCRPRLRRRFARTRRISRRARHLGSRRAARRQRRAPRRSRRGLPNHPARNADLPATAVVELCERAAVLHDEKLGDPEAATPYLERILQQRPGDERAFARLKQILTSAEKWGNSSRSTRTP